MKKYILSDMEREILKIYSRNTNVTLKGIAKLLPISESSVRNYVDNLVAEGILSEPGRSINLERLDGIHLMALLHPHRGVDREEMNQFIQDSPEVIRSVATFTNGIEIMEIYTEDKYSLGRFLTALDHFGTTEVQMIREVKKFKIPLGD